MLGFFAFTNTCYALVNAYGVWHYKKDDKMGAILYGACGIVNVMVVGGILTGWVH